MSATALQLIDLKKTYANGLHALNGINLTIRTGDFFALLGPNGAGKSTTIGIITSLVNKTSGKVYVFGHDLDSEPQAVKASIGLVPQEFNFNIFEKVQFALVRQAGYYGIPYKIAMERSEKYLKKLGLWDKRNTQIRFLSGGQKRRLMIARALLHEPPLLILDEPTAGVDIELRRTMWSFLKEINENGTTIILTTHYLEEAENLCKSIAIINHGQIIENSSMISLLQKLHQQTFILDVENTIFNIESTQFPMRIVSETSVEVDVDRGQSLNDLFAELSAKEIKIVSMRNKANRLEELFLKLTHEIL